MATKDLHSGECQTCGRTAHWCLCGEYTYRPNQPMTDTEAHRIFASRYGEAEADRLCPIH